MRLIQSPGITAPRSSQTALCSNITSVHPRSPLSCERQLKPRRSSAHPAALAARPSPGSPPPEAAGSTRPIASQAGMMLRRSGVCTEAGSEPLPPSPRSGSAIATGGAERMGRSRRTGSRAYGHPGMTQQQPPLGTAPGPGGDGGGAEGTAVI